MTGLALAFIDALLAVLMFALAWGALESRDPIRGVVLFIAFGLVLALVWARLAAPDVALAEAAIGAGLSGALLLTAARDRSPEADSEAGNGQRLRAVSWTLGLLCLGLGVSFAWALVAVVGPGDQPRLADEVAARLSESGVSNPVTAVLLNFRAYDTLLELAVLLAALLGILALGPERRGFLSSGAVFSGLSRWLVPLLLITGGYLLWVGGHAPGGAFQAGAVLGAAGIVLRLAGEPSAGLPRGLALRSAIVGGIGAFLAVGLAVMTAGRPFLSYPAGWAGTLILLIESFATFAIAATLILAFLGGRPAGWSVDPDRGVDEASGGGGRSRYRTARSSASTAIEDTA